MGNSEDTGMKVSELIAELQSYLDEYGDEVDIEIRLQDEDGIYESRITGFEEANGPWIICETQPEESD